MSDVTKILNAIEQGDPQAAEQLLPLVYDELRKLAVCGPKAGPGATWPDALDATALVHEVYVRLVDVKQVQQFKSKGHFYAAAAVAMRRILVEAARRKSRLKHGGGMARQDLDEAMHATLPTPDNLLALDEALSLLAATNPQAAELVQLRYFAGLTGECKQPKSSAFRPARPTSFGNIKPVLWLLQKIEGDGA